MPIYSHLPVQRGRQPEQPPRHNGAKRPTAENHRPCTKAIMATSEAFVPLFNDGMYIVSPVVETFQLIRLILREASLLHHPASLCKHPLPCLSLVLQLIKKSTNQFLHPNLHLEVDVSQEQMYGFLWKRAASEARAAAE